MISAHEIQPIDHGIFLWHHYDPAVKADLFSTGLPTELGTFLVDPIPLPAEAFADQRIAGVIVTNENHQRAAAHFADCFQVPIYAAAIFRGAIQIEFASSFTPGLTAVAIEGAAPGEIAIYRDEAGGTIVIGDALINFDPYGFTFLPRKYCSNFKLMRRSLTKLLDFSFERLLFAHGTPILSGARAKLEVLLRERH
jgi:hypothetical protein